MACKVESIAVITAVKDDPSGLQKLERSIAPMADFLEWVIVDTNGQSLNQLQGEVDAVKIVEPSSIYEAFNIGLANCESSHVIFVGADDVVLPSLRDLWQSVNKKKLDLICALPRGGFEGDEFSIDALLLNNYCQQGLIYSRSLLLEIGFDTRFRIASDYLTNLILANKPELKTESIHVTVVRFGEGGISSTVWDTLFHVEWLEHARSLPELRKSSSFSVAIERMKSARRIRLTQDAFDWPAMRTFLSYLPERPDFSAIFKGLKKGIF